MACAKARRVVVCVFGQEARLGWVVGVPAGMERRGCMDGDRQREREDGYSG